MNQIYKEFLKNPEQEFKMAFNYNNYDEMKKLFNHKKLNKETVVSCLLVAIMSNDKNVTMFLWDEYFNNKEYDFGLSNSLCQGSWVFNYLTPSDLGILIPWINEKDTYLNKK